MPRASGIERDLRHLLRGTVTAEANDRSRRSLDFGRVLERLPAVVVVPRDADDIGALLRYAAVHGVRVSTQAAAHSQGGQSLSDDGVLLDMHGYGRVEEVDAPRRIVTVGAGVLWRDVVTATLASGLIPPVLTDNLHTSVGGTASVGGVGFTSHRHGVQLDNLQRAEVVTGTGDRLWCSADDDRELFERALGGLGQFGVITRVEHRLRRHAPAVRRTMLLYAELAPLLDDVAGLVAQGSEDHLRCGTLRTGGALRYVLGIDTECAATDPDVHRALPAKLQFTARAGPSRLLSYQDFALGNHTTAPTRWSRDDSVVAPGLDLILPSDRAAPFIDELLRSLGTELLNRTKLLLLFLRRSALTRPMFVAPSCESLVLLTVEMVMPRASASEVLALMDELDGRGRLAGAKRYLAGTVRYDGAAWREHYGEQWDPIVRAKSRYDPAGVLASEIVDFAGPARQESCG